MDKRTPQEELRQSTTEYLKREHLRLIAAVARYHEELIAVRKTIDTIDVLTQSADEQIQRIVAELLRREQEQDQ